MLVTFQSSFGPSFGHSLSKPVSSEIPLRCGPRHCGQSLAMSWLEVESASSAVTAVNEVFIGVGIIPQFAALANSLRMDEITVGRLRLCFSRERLRIIMSSRHETA